MIVYPKQHKTDMDKIEKLKAEIKMLKSNMNDRDPLAPNQKAGYLFALADILSFLFALESEEPSNEDLNEEIKRFVAEYGYESSEVLLLIATVARHFAEWGAEHTPLPEDTVLFQKGIEEGKRLMMEDAVEGEVHKYDKFSYVKEKNSKSLTELLAKFNNGDKVKIIIVEEK